LSKNSHKSNQCFSDSQNFDEKDELIYEQAEEIENLKEKLHTVSINT